jgi:hypothetical protein
VAFVAETTGTPAYLIPTLIGAAVAYAASGEASVVFSQRLRQTPKLSQPVGLRAREIMRTPGGYRSIGRFSNDCPISTKTEDCMVERVGFEPSRPFISTLSHKVTRFSFPQMPRAADTHVFAVLVTNGLSNAIRVRR